MKKHHVDLFWKWGEKNRLKINPESRVLCLFNIFLHIEDFNIFSIFKIENLYIANQFL